MKNEQLLMQVNEINKKYELLYEKTGKRFNIFEITNTNYDEVVICRVIYELLDPKGSHFRGYIYLKLFLKHVLKIELPQEEFKTLRVFREYILKENKRRIDLVIKSEKYFIPIEVKIFAEDQVNQCYDYYQAAKKYSEDFNPSDKPKVYYVTLDGHVPSVESAGKLTQIQNSDDYEEVKRISFKEDIHRWLNMCLKEKDTIEVASIRETLLQFINVIESLTDKTEEGKKKEMVELLSKSEENIRSAIEIEKSLVDCKKDMIKKVLSALDEVIQDEKIQSIKIMKPEINNYDFRYNEYKMVEAFYNNKQSSWPGISYKIMDIDESNGTELWLRIEIDHRLFVGYCVTKNKSCSVCGAKDVRAEEILFNPRVIKNSWWIYSYYLLNDDKSKAPNFKYFNDEYFELYNQKKFKEFISEAKRDILKVLGELKNNS